MKFFVEVEIDVEKPSIMEDPDPDRFVREISEIISRGMEKWSLKIATPIYYKERWQDINNINAQQYLTSPPWIYIYPTFKIIGVGL